MLHQRSGRVDGEQAVGHLRPGAGSGRTVKLTASLLAAANVYSPTTSGISADRRKVSALSSGVAPVDGGGLVGGPHP